MKNLKKRIKKLFKNKKLNTGKKIRISIIAVLSLIIAFFLYFFLYQYVLHPVDNVAIDTPASEVIGNFYSEYNNINSVDNSETKSKDSYKNAIDKTNILVAKYGTANFINYFKNYSGSLDPVKCSNETYHSVMISGPKVRGSSFTVEIRNEIVRENIKKATVNFVQVNGEVKIDSITCS